MLGGELSGGPDPGIVPLEEQASAAAAVTVVTGPPAGPPGQPGGRHRPGTPPGDHRLRRQASQVTRLVVTEDGPDLGRGERVPVRLGQLLAHAVNQAGGPCVPGAGHAARRARARSGTPSSVITAATANEQTDADIQLAGVKPIRCRTQVHAETHQER